LLISCVWQYAALGIVLSLMMIVAISTVFGALLPLLLLQLKFDPAHSAPMIQVGLRV